jgi:hypothetical protein
MMVSVNSRRTTNGVIVKLRENILSSKEKLQIRFNGQSSISLLFLRGFLHSNIILDARQTKIASRSMKYT